MTKKKRVDHLLVERGLAVSLDEAHRLVMARKVFLPDRPVQFASERVAETALLTIKEMPRYVSRGGLKLEAALRAFSIDVTHRNCLDLGISTGGFTDCLLQHGAHQVIGIDVGYGQVAHRLQCDPRVRLYERTHISRLIHLGITIPTSLIVADLSFISLQKVLPIVATFIRWQKNGGWGAESNTGVICLHKPQFEVESTQISRGGIVNNEKWRLDSLNKTLALGRRLGWGEGQWIASPVLGQEGNQEYLVYWKRAY